MSKQKEKKHARHALRRRLEEKRFARNLRSKAKKRARRRARGNYSFSQYKVAHPIPRGVREKAWTDLSVPHVLDLEAHFNDTVHFISTVGDVCLIEKRPVRLNFDRVRTIRPSALLLLLAQIHHCRLVRGRDQITGTYPGVPRLERMLDCTGFFDLLRVQSRIEKSRVPDGVEYIKFISESRLAQEAVRRLRNSLLGDDLSMDIVARKRLFRSLSEAMTNVGQHAYPRTLNAPVSIRKRWWLTGIVDKNRNELMITFCDLGVGIPRTLPKLYSMENIRLAVALLPGISPNDSEMIKAAMLIGRSQTLQTNRGKGLNDLRSFIDKSGAGTLRIYSQHGAYTYIAGGSEKAQNYDRALGGTLIQWTVPLDKVTTWNTGGADDYED